MPFLEYREFARDFDWQSASTSSCIFCQVEMRTLELYDWMIEWAPHGDGHVCLNCGWWNGATTERTAWTVDQSDVALSERTYAAVGSLLEFGEIKIEQELHEAQEALRSNYESRFEANPQYFEKIVGSVFKNSGYQVDVTAYQNDGGIDILMSRGSSQSAVGVQVKRYKNKIGVDQIRSFAGALMLKDLARGIFVTTSDYTLGAKKEARAYSEKLVPIELIDANRLFDALGIVTKVPSPLESLVPMIKDSMTLFSQFKSHQTDDPGNVG